MLAMAFCAFWLLTLISLSTPRFLPLSALPNFDPRTVPVVGVDAHLPAVAAEHLHAQALRERFANPPTWAPEVLAEKRFSNRMPAHAAVLIPIVQREQPMVLLTERTHHLSTHSGQIAFPGGKTDDDEHAAATALREAHEEVGLEPHHVEVLGHLPVYVTGTAFIITPVVALVQPSFTLTPNAHEVADVFEVPLAFLMDPAQHHRHALEWEDQRREWFSMPYIDIQAPGQPERFIWGATAGMLRNFYRFLSA